MKRQVLEFQADRIEAVLARHKVSRPLTSVIAAQTGHEVGITVGDEPPAEAIPDEVPAETEIPDEQPEPIMGD